jgi:hypothetical protein
MDGCEESERGKESMKRGTWDGTNEREQGGRAGSKMRGSSVGQSVRGHGKGSEGEKVRVRCQSGSGARAGEGREGEGSRELMSGRKGARERRSR